MAADYNPYRYSASFDDIRAMAGTCRIEAERTDSITRSAYLHGAADALYALAPVDDFPRATNIIRWLTGVSDGNGDMDA